MNARHKTVQINKHEHNQHRRLLNQQLVDRIISASNAGVAVGLDAFSIAMLAEAFKRAAMQGISLDRALNLSPEWRISLRNKYMRAAAANLRRDDESASNFGRRMRGNLVLYQKRYYIEDRNSEERPRGERGWMFDVLIGSRGKVPGEQTLRKLLGQPRFERQAAVTTFIRGHKGPIFVARLSKPAKSEVLTSW